MIGKKIEPFRVWCQKVLPNVYDDSLSYYEYLCKMNEYINEVIEQMNTLTEAEEDFQENLSAQWTAYKNGLNAEWLEYKTNLNSEWNTYKTELTQAWTTTKNYIDNYFDNLDVQEEINTKLDEMVVDGTMTTLLTAIVGSDISPLVTAWLNENVDPVGSAVVVDSSLSVSGAAADAKVTGDEIKLIDVSKRLMTTSDIVDNVGITNDGKEYSNSSYLATDFISLENAIYGKYLQITSTLVGLFGIAFYDDNKLLVDAINGNTASARGYSTGTEERFIPIPKYAKYFRATFLKASGYVDPNSFNIHFYNYDKASNVMDMNLKGVNVEQMENALQNTFNEVYVNYNVDFSNDDHYARYDTGVVISYTGIDCSDYIQCDNVRKLRVSGKNFFSCTVIAFYNENHGFIGAYPNSSTETTYTNEIIDVPLNAKYFIANNYNNLTKIEYLSKYAVDTESKKWSDKTWVCFGDSLTAINEPTTIRYFDYIHDETGIQTVNMGSSGTGYANDGGNGRAFYQRIGNCPNADVITIFGSFNDLAVNIPLGTASDTGTGTMGGCINQTIDNLYAVRPIIQLGIIAPTPWVSSNANPTTEPNSGSQYVELLREICLKRGIPFLDLFHCSALRPWDAAYRELVYDKDPSHGIHPNEIGHKIIASHIESFVETLLLH